MSVLLGDGVPFGGDVGDVYLDFASSYVNDVIYVKGEDVWKKVEYLPINVRTSPKSITNIFLTLKAVLNTIKYGSYELSAEDEAKLAVPEGLGEFTKLHSNNDKKIFIAGEDFIEFGHRKTSPGAFATLHRTHKIGYLMSEKPCFDVTFGFDKYQNNCTHSIGICHDPENPFINSIRIEDGRGDRSVKLIISTDVGTSIISTDLIFASNTNYDFHIECDTSSVKLYFDEKLIVDYHGSAPSVSLDPYICLCNSAMLAHGPSIKLFKFEDYK